MSKYSPAEISQFADEITITIQALATGTDVNNTLIDTAETVKANGAPKLSLDVMASSIGLLSLIPGALNKLAISVPLAKVSQAFSIAQVSQASIDNEYTWEDYAALSNAIGSTLATFPATALPAALFLLLGAATPKLNSIGGKLGGAAYDAINSDTNTFLLQAKNWTPPRTDPLVLDLDNDGIETIGINGTAVVFDHDGDGIKTGTGWVASDDGLLVMDRMTMAPLIPVQNCLVSIP